MKALTILSILIFTHFAVYSQKSEADKIKASFDESMQQWNKANLEECLKLFAEDITLIRNGEEDLKGKKAIRDSWGELLKNFEPKIEYSVQTVKATQEMAYLTGSAVMTNTKKDGEKISVPPPPFKFKFLHILQKENNQWQIKAYMYNDAPKN
jgi:uncharacterized protein (TIGR02246 family)